MSYRYNVDKCAAVSLAVAAAASAAPDPENNAAELFETVTPGDCVV